MMQIVLILLLLILLLELLFPFVFLGFYRGGGRGGAGLFSEKRSVVLGTMFWFSAMGITPASQLLTLQQAHDAALHNHPRITVADLRTLTAEQVTREARAGFFPSISGNVVAVGTAGANTRLAAIGGLNNPSIFERNAEGLSVSQLITDFGRTANLTRSAKLRAEAEADNAQATREQLLLEVDAAYFAALQAQAVTRVAQQTVTTRQFFLDQVTALASNQLRSDLDVSFARVNLEDARLLLSKAESDLQAGFTQLSTLMGERAATNYQLVEEPVPAQLSTNVDLLVEQALKSRPDLQQLRNQTEAARRFTSAERALRYPTISAVGAAGILPIHDPQLPDTYAAAGVGLSLPLFTGGLYSARAREAELRAQAVAESLRDAENNAVRDVRIAWLNAQNAFDRMRISSQLVANAKKSYDLAQARYNNKVSSIVELNQAQLNEIQAEITDAQTRYEYLLRRSALNFQTGQLR
jgi:outer membrane protein